MPNTFEFMIIFPAPPAVFAFMMAVMIALMVYWAIKFVVSLYTGA
jgi:hypothetical protein